jgi:hypothetical protein
MFKYRTAMLISSLLILSVLTSGCVKTTATQQSVIDAVQAYLDSPPDASKPDLLTAEERAAIESFTIVHNIVKTQLVENTANNMWEQIGRKMVTAYAQACRAESVLEAVYYGQLWIMAEPYGKRDNFKVGDFTYQNRNDRIEVQLYNPVSH